MKARDTMCQLDHALRPLRRSRQDSARKGLFCFLFCLFSYFFNPLFLCRSSAGDRTATFDCPLVPDREPKVPAPYQ